jgi:hypothetical protein
VDRDALLKEAPGWLDDWSIQAESQGCVAMGDGERLARLVVDSLPMDPAASAWLLSVAATSAYVDLGPYHRLQVNSPILREGAAAEAAAPEISKIEGSGGRLDVELKPAAGVIGYETAWYAVVRNEGRPGYHFAPLAADRNIQGTVEHASGPATNYFQFLPQAAYFRLFYKTQANTVLAIVICGTTRADLDRRTKAVGDDLESCRRESGMCVELSRGLGVNPFLAVTVNGGEVRVSLGATVGSALSAAGIRDAAAVLPELQVSRLFGGRPTPVEFDRAARDILNLRLLGGEQISFPSQAR